MRFNALPPLAVDFNPQKKEAMSTITKTNKEQGNFGAVLRLPIFNVLLGSETISLIGDRLVAIALVTLVYDITQSAASVSSLLILKAIPALLLGSAAGTLADRLNRKWVMVASNLAQGLLVLFIPFASSLRLVYVIYLIMSIINQLFIPARAATIPDVVPEKQLITANSLFSMAYVGAIALGPAIGGFVIDQFGLNAAFFVDSATFLVPALAVGLLTLPRRSQPTTQNNFIADMKAGLAYIRTRSDIMAGLLMSSMVYFAIGAISVLGIVIAKETLGTGAGGYGMMMSVMGVGLLVGAILMGKYGTQIDRTRLAAVGAIIGGVAVALLPWATNLYLALLISAFSGVGMVMVQASANTTYQTSPENLRGRVLGVAQALLGASSFLAMGLAGFAAEWLGLTAVLGIAGLAAFLPGVLVLLQSKK